MTIDKAQLIALAEANHGFDDCLLAPDVVIDIVSHIENLEAKLAGLRTGYDAQNEVIAGLRAENEALRKDAERYRWLRSRDLETINRGGVFAGMTPENLILNEETLDEAIDVAMVKESWE